MKPSKTNNILNPQQQQNHIYATKFYTIRTKMKMMQQQQNG